MKINEAGLNLIKNFEGLSLTAYPDPGTKGEPYTIGYGHTGGVKRGQRITREEADRLLREDVARFEAAVVRAIGDAPTTPNQFAAMVSFAFNVGPGNLRKSSVLRHHLARNYARAADSFRLWNKAAGRVMSGLTRRREAERKLYLTP